jgi:hypothetical protein
MNDLQLSSETWLHTMRITLIVPSYEDGVCVSQSEW